VHFPAGPQVIAGRNAAGKTNLLEALALLADGRSHRAASDADMIAWGADFARLEASVEAADETGPWVDAAIGDAAAADATPRGSAATLEVVLLGTSVPGPRKRIKVNGVPRRASALSAVLRAVLFAPEDMLLVIGSPSLRRTLLDQLVVQRTALAASSLSTYARALAQRNNLLRRIREEVASRDELHYWDGVLCLEGGRILGWRAETLAALATPLAEAHAEIAPGEGELALRYLTNAPALPGESPEQALRRRLVETAEKEVWNGVTLVGPHRDDFSFELDGREFSTFASRGQQRTAILALKLAQLDLLATIDGRPPLLLLDDVFSELDPERRAHLVRRISGLPQAFVTTTTLDDLDQALVRASTAWHVEPGALQRAG